jgi:hypothetical protein
VRTILSAFTNAAVLCKLRLARARDLLAADGRELGPVPEWVRAEIAAEWPD